MRYTGYVKGSQKVIMETQNSFQGQPGSVLGDHPALDLLNTVVMVDGALVDQLQADRDVVQWLAAVGAGVETDAATPKNLVGAARRLREILRGAVACRKSGKAVDVAPINEFLARGESSLVLSPGPRKKLTVERRWAGGTAEQVLAPIAEAGAELLATGDFELVRRCESADCVLWFYDRTKSHRRRWCSMASCGNRHKVAAFRERQKAES
jgi:predicted RNA-binding Zn ribbon-like protein